MAGEYYRNATGCRGSETIHRTPNAGFPSAKGGQGHSRRYDTPRLERGLRDYEIIYPALRRELR